MPFGKTPEAKASGEKSTISQADTNGQASPRFNFYSPFVKRPRELAVIRGNARAVGSNRVASSVLDETPYKRKETDTKTVTGSPDWSCRSSVCTTERSHNYSTALLPSSPSSFKRRSHSKLSFLLFCVCAVTDEDLKVRVLTTKVTAMKILLEVLAQTGEKSLLTSGKGGVYKGNPVQSCRDGKNGSAAAAVDIPEVVSVGKGMKPAAVLPVVTPETSCRDLQKFQFPHEERFLGRQFFMRIFLSIG